MPPAEALAAWQAFAVLAARARTAAEQQDWPQALALGAELTRLQPALPDVAALSLDAAGRSALRLTLEDIQANIGASSRLLGRERDTLSEEMHHLRTRSRVLDAYSKGA